MEAQSIKKEEQNVQLLKTQYDIPYIFQMFQKFGCNLEYQYTQIYDKETHKLQGYKCILLDHNSNLRAEGTSNNKQKAKHEAAIKLFNDLQEKFPEHLEVKHTSVPTIEDGNEVLFVYTVASQILKTEIKDEYNYDFNNEFWKATLILPLNPDENQFIKTEGFGSNKKNAKLEAAKEMKKELGPYIEELKRRSREIMKGSNTAESNFIIGDKKLFGFVHSAVQQVFKEAPKTLLNRKQGGFECVLTVPSTGLKTFGFGSSKREAKHRAAEGLLDNLVEQELVIERTVDLNVEDQLEVARLPRRYTFNRGILDPKLLDIETRDKHYRALFTSRYFNTLLDHHKREIKRRGIPLQLARKLYFTSWESIKVRLNYKGLNSFGRLAGTNVEGNRTCGPKGIIIPAFSPLFKITGAQIKTDSGEPKYIWLSSTSQGGVSCKLPNLDLPLFSWNHPIIFQKKYKSCYQYGTPIELKNCVGLCEGGLKSLIAAYKIGIPFIGAGGVDFVASSSTLLNYLDILNKETIILFPDAGINVNPNVAKSVMATILQLIRHKKKICVAWWDQSTYENSDVDELTARELQKLTLMSPFDFFHTVFDDQLKNQLRDYTPELDMRLEEAKDFQRIKPYHKLARYLNEKDFSKIIEITNDEATKMYNYPMNEQQRVKYMNRFKHFMDHYTYYDLYFLSQYVYHERKQFKEYVESVRKDNIVHSFIKVFPPNMPQNLLLNILEEIYIQMYKNEINSYII